MKDSGNSRTPHIVETEEQANDAFFNKLESEIYSYCAQHDAMLEQLDEQREFDRLEEELAIDPLCDGDYSRKRIARVKRSYDDQLQFTGINCTESEFIEWFLLTSEGQHFHLVDNRLIAKEPKWWDEHFIGYGGKPLIVASMTKILDHQLQKKNEAAIAEINQLAETAKKALGLT